ncbi:hypothetical protein MBLNU230_g7069t1 [Neophaeotheca triangularis]
MKYSALAATFATAVAAQRRGNYIQPPIQTNVSVFDPPDNYTLPRVLYGRVRALECTEKDVLLATWENYLPTETPLERCPDNCPENPYLPIYQSYDQGQTWSERSRVYDTENGWGLRYQPELFELTEKIGDFDIGTLVVAANSLPSDINGTKIDIYTSCDEGYTWEFASSVATGGYGLPENQYDPVWEPFIATYEGKLIVYYADQREDRADIPEGVISDERTLGQKLVHQVTEDLLNWGPVVDDVRYEDPRQRPGMPIITELPNGKWFFSFEWLNVEAGTGFEYYYRLADSPLSVADAEDVPLLPYNTDTQPTGTPYMVWTPAGGPDGTILCSDNNSTSVFINRELGNPDAWEEVETPAGTAYSRSMTVLPNDPSRIMIMSPGDNNSEGLNEVLVTTIDVDDEERPYPVPYTGHQRTTGQCAAKRRNGAGKGKFPGSGKGKGKGKDGECVPCCEA